MVSGTFRLTRVSVVRSVELKKMERCYGLHIIFDQIPKLHHASDGVVFTPVRLPYIPGTSPRLWVLIYFYLNFSGVRFAR